MKQYRVAILGCRARGTAAGRAYAAHPCTEVVALCDLVSERLEALGAELGVAARDTDLDRMMETERPDLVVVPTGTEFHFPLSLRVLEYGAHLDVEKPICQELEQADALLQKAAERGCQVAVHHQSRCGPAFRKVRELVETGALGCPRYFYASGKGYYGGYGLMNIGTHLINNLVGLAGPCRAVTATATTHGQPVTPEDVRLAPGGMGMIVGESLVALLEFEAGVTATLVHQRLPKVDSAAYAIEVFGTEGRAFWKQHGAWRLDAPHFIPDGEHSNWTAEAVSLPPGFDPEGTADAAEYAYVEEYVRALDTGTEHECSGAAGRHVLEVIMGIFEAAAYGRRVELPQARRDHPLLRWRWEAGLGDLPPVPRDYTAWLAAETARMGR